MSPVTAQILDKLNHFEQVSQPTLKFVLDFVCYLESRLQPTSKPIIVDEATQETTASFLLDLVDSFQEGLTDEDLVDLPQDGAENHDHYLYNRK